MTKWTFLCAALLLPSAQLASASDGVLEINQACAVNTGCFSPGDPPGYPVTLTAAGSYRLTSNLAVPDEDTDGIVIYASDVDLDLNGFAIVRSGCEGSSADCTPTSGTGLGISQSFTLLPKGISVRNGSVTGMGLNGIHLGEQSTVIDLRARWNRGGGIVVGSASAVSEISAYQNGSDGISAGDGSTVSGCVAQGNGGDGISAGAGSAVSDNVVRANGDKGLSLNIVGSYRDNTLTGNTTGDVVGGVNLGGNLCGTAACP